VGRIGAVHMIPDTPAGLIRPARPADAPALAAVHVATWRDAYAGLLPDEFLAPAGDQITRRRCWAGRRLDCRRTS
jgi:hypothetical protein